MVALVDGCKAAFAEITYNDVWLHFLVLWPAHACARA